MWTPEQIERSFELSITALSARRNEVEEQTQMLDNAIATLQKCLAEHRERAAADKSNNA